MKRVLKFSLLSVSLATSFITSANQTNIEVLSATIKDKKISDAQVVVQRNGEQSLTAVSDTNGKAIIASPYPDTGDNLILIKKEGYSTLVAKCPCNGMSYALSPTMKGLDSMRVVLSWGAMPSDLDSYMAYPSNHLYFSHKTGNNGNLDVDDVDSYGPETITLTKRENGQSYVYAVHDFSDQDQPDTINLSASEAKVFVYVGESLVRTYYVPTGKQGNLWTVFRVNKNGDIEDINSVQGITSSVAGKLQPLLNDGAAIEAQQWSSENINISEALNLQGEAAYNNKQYKEAIRLFTDAVNNHPENGKAYGNLGLVYQKTGRTAEAIWANRKAIALASGSGASTIRAGANYNIGKIYEAANKYSDAFVYYKAAKNEKQNPVYDNAITRVSSKIN